MMRSDADRMIGRWVTLAFAVVSITAIVVAILHHGGGIA